MNINVAEKKVNSFSIGNPASGLGDAIVGTYGPTKPGQCDQYQPPVDFPGNGNSGSNDDGCKCGGCCGKKEWYDYVIEIIGIIADLVP